MPPLLHKAAITTVIDNCHK